MRKLALGSLVVAVLFAVAPPGAQADVRFDLKGQWTCKDGSTVKPMSGARIELWRSRSYWRDEKITSRHLGGDGRYSIPVKASDNFDLYVKILLKDDDGVELENWYSPFTWETTTSTKRSRSGTVDLGTWQISKDGSGTPKCAIWQGVHNAYGNFRQIIGSRPPSNVKIEGEFPCCGTPFTTTNTIRWPGGYAVRANYSVPFHEFAHSVRHSFDGNFGHFLIDAGRYQYPQTHTSCKVTNQGFAFNEGWAEYWAGDYSTCSPATNYNQEGNVAAELARLERCSNRPAMVRVLRESRGQIHSIGDFQSRFTAILGGCAQPLTTSTGAGEPVLSAQQQIADLQGQIARQRKLVASLKRRARRAGLVQSTELTAQAQQAALVLDRLEQGLAAARKAGFDPAKQVALGDSLLKNQDADALAYRRILNTQLDKAVKEIRTRPGLKRLRRGGAFKTLKQRADALNVKTRGEAKVDDLFAAPPVADESVRKVR